MSSLLFCEQNRRTFIIQPDRPTVYKHKQQTKMRMKLISRILQNTRKPHGFWGRMMLRGMNCGHARVAEWGMSMLEWMPQWDALDIGCGGGANISRMLQLCSRGRVCGVDLSPESVAFARKKNRHALGRRCAIEQGSADLLPYADASFDIVTAFETIYFWPDLNGAFRQIDRVLKDGGLFMVCNEASNPNNTFWTNRIEGMTVHSAEEIGHVLTNTGFDDISINYGRGEEICIIARKPHARAQAEKSRRQGATAG